VPVAQRDSSIIKLIDLFNAGDVEKLTNLSQKPFVFDGEIILIGQDLELLYGTLKESGFSFENYQIAAIEPVNDESHKIFADTMEIRVFFERYVKSTAVVVTVSDDSGSVLFLLDGKDGEYPQVHGIKVL
jgi:hypothetical protein